MTSNKTYFSLFAGVGGFDLALQRLGWKCVGACEIDKYASEKYKYNFHVEKIYDDATKTDPSILPDFTMLCAGFPCQSFSVAGKRRGFGDTRGTLFFEIIRFITAKRPSLVLLENVAGLLYHEEGKTFETILSKMDEVGYDVEWQVFNSKYFVPQNRERIFIIGHSRETSTRQILPLGELCKVSDETCKTKYLPSLTATDYKGPSKQRITNTVIETGEKY